MTEEKSTSGDCLYGLYNNEALKDYDKDGQYELMYKSQIINVELQRALGWIPTRTPILAITNKTSAARGLNFQVGDTWQIDITNSVPDSLVDISQDGGSNWLFQFGGQRATAGGAWTRSGTFTSGDVGDYQGMVRIPSGSNGFLSFPPIRYSVSDAATPTSSPTPTPSQTVTPAPTISPTGCSDPTFSPWPPDWARPCPVFASSPASVPRTGTLTLTVAPPSGTTYIYKTIYLYDDTWNCSGKRGVWCPLMLPGTLDAQASDYHVKNSGSTLTLQSSTLQNLSLGTHYVAQWDWTWNSTKQCYVGADGVCYNPDPMLSSKQYRLQTFTVL